MNLILALLCLIGNSRHLCLMLVIQDFLLFLIYHINKREIVVSFSRIISWGISLVLVLAIVYKGYAYLAESGALGEYGKWKYENQKKEKGGIASSRNEPIRALCTLSHYPLGGLKNAGKEVSDNYEIRKEYAQIIGGTIRSDKSLTGHSAILDWWVIYGIFTFPFWIYILKLLLESLKTMFAGFNNPLLALVLYSSLTMFWNILFSPFGGRIGYGMGIMLILYNLSFSQQKK